jgi:hypothetical protein
MKLMLLVLIVSLLLTSGISAQENDWRSSGNSTVEYNCDTYSDLLATFQSSSNLAIQNLGEEPITRLDNGEVQSLETYIAMYILLSSQQNMDTEITLEAILSEPAIACSDSSSEEASTVEITTVLFNVIANGNGNLRSCAGTNCDIVGHVAVGDLLGVVAEEGDWYQVQTENGTAFIATFLATRGPDEVIAVDEPYFDVLTGCFIVFDIKRGDMDMNFIFSGGRRDDVVVDLYRPNESSPLSVEGQLDKTFIDTGEPYIHQYYSWNVGYPVGLYNLEISLDGNTSRLGWQMETTGEYFIHVQCD